MDQRINRHAGLGIPDLRLRVGIPMEKCEDNRGLRRYSFYGGLGNLFLCFWGKVSKRYQCFQEAKYYAHDFYKTAIIPALDGGVLKSYIGFDEEIRLDLKAAANALRVSTGIQEVEVSIVDPHLFPFAWDKTRVLRKCRVTRTNCIYKSGEGEIVKEPPKEDCPEPDHGRYRNDMAYSNRFQWLPFDVEFEDGTSR